MSPIQKDSVVCQFKVVFSVEETSDLLRDIIWFFSTVLNAQNSKAKSDSGSSTISFVIFSELGKPMPEN